jgi:hypothetical protein
MVRSLDLSMKISAPAMVSKQLRSSCIKQQSGYVECLNHYYNEDVLDAQVVENQTQVRAITEKWMEDYNEHYQHASLGI